MAGSIYTAEGRRVFCPRLLIGILGTAMCFYLDELEFIKMTFYNPLAFGEGSIACVLNYLTGSYTFGGVFCKYLMPILAALPCSASYCAEENSRMLLYKISRSGKGAYCRAKALTAAIGGGLTALLGTLLFAAALGTYLPLTTPQFITESQGLPYDSLLSRNGGIGFLAVIVYLTALSGALLAEAGLWISAYLPNPYVALCFPMVFKFLLVQSGRLLRLPDSLRLDKLLHAAGTFYSDGATLAVVALTVAALIALMGVRFRKAVERRLENAS